VTALLPSGVQHVLVEPIRKKPGLLVREEPGTSSAANRHHDVGLATAIATEAHGMVPSVRATRVLVPQSGGQHAPTSQRNRAPRPTT
jgi:hypothetical protein